MLSFVYVSYAQVAKFNLSIIPSEDPETIINLQLVQFLFGLAVNLSTDEVVAKYFEEHIKL